MPVSVHTGMQELAGAWDVTRGTTACHVCEAGIIPGQGGWLGVRADLEVGEGTLRLSIDDKLLLCAGCKDRYKLRGFGGLAGRQCRATPAGRFRASVFVLLNEYGRPTTVGGTGSPSVAGNEQARR